MRGPTAFVRTFATVLHFCGRYAEAIEEATEAVAANSTSVRAHLILGLAREQQGRMVEAVTAFETAGEVSRGKNPGTLGALGHACARSCKNEAAERAVKALNELHPEVTCWAKALVRVGMDDRSEALDYFDACAIPENPVS